jgi:hypothetical protein
MVMEGLDVVVEAAKVQEKKLFKDVVAGGSNKPPDDVPMEGTVNNMPISDQPAIGAGTSSKADKKLRNGCLEKMVENLRYEVTSPLVGDYIQYMKDHIVIGNSWGFGPRKKR